MASQKVEAMMKPKVVPTLGLLGATVNAMALIAPGRSSGLPTSFRQPLPPRVVRPAPQTSGAVLSLP